MTSSFFLPFYKQKGKTSAHALNEFKRVTGIKKAGYCGTLDPLAEGLLIFAIDKATKLIRFFTEDIKKYKGTMIFGMTSDSYDMEGNIDVTNENPQITPEELKKFETKFKGEIIQTPPVYSAVKVRGKRACDRARSGEEVLLAERTVSIYDIKLTQVTAKEVDFEVTCSKGTYIRSLVSDIGKEQGDGALLSKLIRTGVGDIGIENSVTIEEIKEKPEILNERAIPIDEPFPWMNKISDLSEDIMKNLYNGIDLETMEIPLKEGYNIIYEKSSPLYILEKRENTLSYTAYIGENR